jgi:protein-S-isoprenylcysteine O-methyltransferase Ste14
MSKRLKAIGIAIVIVLVAAVLWFAETMFLSGASSLSVVRQWAFITFGVGLLIGVLIIALLWWREQRLQRQGEEREDT